MINPRPAPDYTLRPISGIGAVIRLGFTVVSRLKRKQLGYVLVRVNSMTAASTLKLKPVSLQQGRKFIECKILGPGQQFHQEFATLRHKSVPEASIMYYYSVD
jgi:hypothetical protein